MILTEDYNNGAYFDFDGIGCLAGFRRLGDRRYWMAWRNTESISNDDVTKAVMDDFGTLVETWHIK